MADKEYIEREGYIDKLKFKRDNGINRGNKYPGLESAIAQAQKYPAADVAPRSEVAREIFEELERFIDANNDRFYTQAGNYVGQCVGVGSLKRAFDELKKKYIIEGSVALEDRLADAAERSAETGHGNVGKDEFVKEQ